MHHDDIAAPYGRDLFRSRIAVVTLGTRGACIQERLQPKDME